MGAGASISSWKDNDTVFYMILGMLRGTVVVFVCCHFPCTIQEMEPAILLPFPATRGYYNLKGISKYFPFTNIFEVVI